MRAFYLVALCALLWGCKNDEPQDQASRVHTIELADDPLEMVEVSVAGRDDLKISVFQRDGRLVAAIVDEREIESIGSREQIQRWEMLAKSNSEVSITTRKDFHWLESIEAPDKAPVASEEAPRGTALYSDTDGNGIPDYLFSPDGKFKVSAIVYEESETAVTSFDIHELPAANPNEEFPASPSE